LGRDSKYVTVLAPSLQVTWGMYRQL